MKIPKCFLAFLLIISVGYFVPNVNADELNKAGSELYAFAMPGHTYSPPSMSGHQMYGHAVSSPSAYPHQFSTPRVVNHSVSPVGNYPHSTYTPPISSPKVFYNRPSSSFSTYTAPSSAPRIYNPHMTTIPNDQRYGSDYPHSTYTPPISSPKVYYDHPNYSSTYTAPKPAPRIYSHQTTTIPNDQRYGSGYPHSTYTPPTAQPRAYTHSNSSSSTYSTPAQAPRIYSHQTTTVPNGRGYGTGYNKSNVYHFTGHYYNHWDKHDREIWRSGHWWHARYRGIYGWWWITGGIMYFYDEPVYPYPLILPDIEYYAPYDDQTIFDPDYWYYCQDPQGYYPYITQCPGGWLQVVPPPGTPDQ